MYWNPGVGHYTGLLDYPAWFLYPDWLIEESGEIAIKHEGHLLEAAPCWNGHDAVLIC